MFIYKPALLLILLGVFSVVIDQAKAQVPVAPGANTSAANVYDIPSQSLSDVVQVFGEQSGLQILYPSVLLEGKQSAGLQGRFSVSEALETLTQGQGVEFLFVGNNAVILRAAQSPVEIVEEKPRQTQPDDSAAGVIETVQVTGSRLPRPEFEFLYPTLTVDRDYLFQTSATDIGTTLESLPSVCSGGFSIENEPIERNIGSSFPDLYCLGSQRTLTLINGHRVVSNNTVSVIGFDKGSQFDVNAIPNSMIERVEVVSVGGAPVYGADAIAGTINIILKDNFDGFELDLSGGISDRKDGENFNLSLLAGKNFFQDKANVTMGYEYHKQRAIHATAREYTASDFTYFRIDDQDPVLYRDVSDILQTEAGFPFILTQETGELFFLDDGQGNFLALDERGSFVPFDLSAQIVGRYFQGGPGRRESERWSLRLPLERHMVSVLSSYEISDNIKLFSEIELFSARSSTRAFNTFSNRYFVNPDNPFVLNGTRATILENFQSLRDLGYDGEFEFLVYKELVDISGFETGSKNELARGIFGVEGNFYAGGEWSWSASFNRGYSYTETIDFEIFKDDFYRAAGIDTNSFEACSPGRPDNPSPCFDAIRFSLLGVTREGEVRDSLATQGKYFARQDQEVFNLHIRGELDLLPSGPVSVALGAQRRLESASAEPDAFNEQSLGFFSPVDPVFGAFSTKEIYGELLIPVLDDSFIPLVDSFTLETSFRQLEHSKAGSDVAWTIGGRLSLDGPGASTITLRGNATESVRAPSITENSAPLTPVASSGSLIDPCSVRAVENADDPEFRRAACEAEVEAFMLADSFSLDDFDSTIELDSVAIIGNQELKNERAQSNTVGFVFQSSGGDSAQLAVDLINIRIDDLIEQDFGVLLNACYEPDPQEYCSFYQRNSSTFELSRPLFPYQNLGRLRFRAVQLAASLPLPLVEVFGESSQMSLDLQGYVLNERRLDDGPNQAGTYLDPESNWRVALNYARGNLDLSWTAFFQDSVRYQLYPNTGVPDFKVPAFWQHFLAARYQVNGSLAVRAGVKNVFDWQPEDVLESVDAKGAYAPIGREYLLGLNLVF